MFSEMAARLTHLAELHLSYYHECKREYVLAVQNRVRREGKGQQLTLAGRVKDVIPFSSPRDPDGYDDHSITNDIITEVYLQFGQLRARESAAYLRTLTGKSIHNIVSVLQLTLGPKVSHCHSTIPSSWQRKPRW